jgi:hypothetical protein
MLFTQRRGISVLGSSQRPMSRRRAPRFLKIDNLSAGVAARAPPLDPVPAPARPSRRYRACNTLDGA